MKLLPFLALTLLYGCSPSAPSADSGVPYETGPTTTTVAVYEALPDTTMPVTRAKGKRSEWLCEFYPQKIRFLYHSGKDSVILRYDSQREIRNNEILSPVGVNFDKQDFSFERDPRGLENYENRTAPNVDSTSIRIKKGKTTYEGILVKVKK